MRATELISVGLIAALMACSKNSNNPGGGASGAEAGAAGASAGASAAGVGGQAGGAAGASGAAGAATGNPMGLSPEADYSDNSNWVCKPGLTDNKCATE